MAEPWSSMVPCWPAASPAPLLREDASDHFQLAPGPKPSRYTRTPAAGLARCSMRAVKPFARPKQLGHRQRPLAERQAQPLGGLRPFRLARRTSGGHRAVEPLDPLALPAIGDAKRQARFVRPATVLDRQ
jgi:hypothetical protein